MISNLLFYLKISRPGLWFAAIWLYILPTGQMESLLYSWTFWYGLFYVTFPLNFIVYGWNDIVDYEIDKHNIRKDSFWFGARASKEQLDKLGRVIVLAQLLFFTPLLFFSDWKITLVFAAFILRNGLYNLPGKGLRTLPPLELLAQVGYLLIVPLSIYINDTKNIPILTYVYLLLFAWQSHLMGEVMDIEPDRASGRKTTATILGVKKAKWLIISIVIAEVLLMFIAYNEYIFGGFLALGLLWLLLDVLVLFKSNNYTVGQMKLFALGSNAVAFITMIYVWYSGCLI